MTASHTTATLAAILDTTPRELRKFLRAESMGVGKGSRYSLPTTKKEITSIAKRFAAWRDARTPIITETPESPESDITPELDESLESLEPTDADLAAIDAE